jgi:nucleotide-binding universal stress UspA family protein
MTMRAFDAVVVATDFSVTARHAANRALVLPFAADARVTLVHVVKPTFLATWGEGPRQDAEEELERLRSTLEARAPAGVRVAARVARGTPYVEIVRVARAERAELVVLGRTGRSPVRDHLIGSTAEQVVRNGDASVLLVRSGRMDPYRRPVCAVDAGSAAPEVLRLASRVAPEAAGPLSAVHVYDSPFEGMFFPSLRSDQLREYRDGHRDTARETLANELVGAGLAPGSWRLILRHGSPRARIPAEVDRLEADLLALGTHARRGPAYALLGSVAGDVLRAVACDTLVVRTGGVTVERP